MATETKTSGGDATASGSATKAKLSADFIPNEPSAKTGLDATGNLDGSLSPKQLVRAGTEAMLSLRPQPSREQMEKVIETLLETDDKGQPKIKVKTAKEGGEKAVGALS